jgi:hypothetical protein
MSANRNASIEAALARALDARIEGGPAAAQAVVDRYPHYPELGDLLAVVDEMREALQVTVPPATQARHELLLLAELLRPSVGASAGR